MQPIISVRDLSKKYKLGVFNAKTLREEAEAFLARFSRKKEDRILKIGDRGQAGAAADRRSEMGGRAQTSASYLPSSGAESALQSSPSAPDEFWALRDVSFDVQPGEVIGVIGRNGAGKSTLLKILSRITEPTSGEARIRGRVASLLEVGTGFHPELSGRENVFLNGAILGMTKQEIRNKFDEIVAFAEIEKFIDTPVKRYSSGMYVRLAFAVAAHLEPEILIVDEVLAVGDAAFQKKCLRKMREVSRLDGRTVLFVSHQMATVSALCSRMILLNSGKIDFEGPTSQGIQRYLNSGEATLSKRRQLGPGTNLSSAVIVDAWMERNGERKQQFIIGDKQVTVNVLVETPKATKCAVELALRDEKGYPIAFAPSGLGFGVDYELATGRHVVSCILPPLMLAHGSYSIDVLLAESGVRLIDSVDGGIQFSIEETFFGPSHWKFPQQLDRGCSLWSVEFLPSRLLHEQQDSHPLA